MNTALITGSSSGIGAEIALELSKNGYKVFLTGRNKEKLKMQADKCNATGYFIGDLKSIDVCNELFNAALEKLGNIDVLINNAGEYIWSPIGKTPENKIEEVFRVNLIAPYLLTKLVIENMKQKKYGRVITIGSISGVVGEANATLYSASKAGLIGLTKALALEVAEYGITVNIINPGWVKTELTNKCLSEGIINEAEQMDMIPQKRWIEPYEISALVKYLTSDEAMGITGQSINLCAGLSLG